MADTPSESDNRSHALKVPTTIFLGMVIVSFSLRLILGELCPIQEMFISILLSVGCGGLYGLYIEMLNVELLSKYKIVGSAGIAVVLLFFLSPATYRDNPPKCKGIFSTNWNVQLVNSAYAGTIQPALGLEHKVIRIIYPIGVNEDKEVANEIKRKIDERFPGIEVTIWSRGSWKTAIANQFRDFPNTIKLIAPASLSFGEVNSLTSAIQDGINYTIERVNNEDPGSSIDIRIEVGF